MSRLREEVPIHVVHEGGDEEWTIQVTGDGPWVWRLLSADKAECEVTGSSAFEALRTMQDAVSEKDVVLCCNGLRANVRPSHRSASHGAWMVYLLHLWRPATVRDLVHVFDYAPPEKIASRNQQDQYWEHHLAARKKWWNLANPIWWLYFATASWGKPKAFKKPPEVRARGERA
ncbi:hypothetical protein ACFW4X_35300 [Streptomyces smyrnaeus]|uniref:hypothetical protein n=1 Tax=Streptomyces smyrnaeus TaxID=1387713 RepID=UPI0036B877D6